jgi:hypothetical protein
MGFPKEGFAAELALKSFIIQNLFPTWVFFHTMLNKVQFFWIG